MIDRFVVGKLDLGSDGHGDDPQSEVFVLLTDGSAHRRHFLRLGVPQAHDHVRRLDSVASAGATTDRVGLRGRGRPGGDRDTHLDAPADDRRRLRGGSTHARHRQSRKHEHEWFQIIERVAHSIFGIVASC